MQHTKIPFSLNRNDGHPLVVQLADGLRQAIIDGYYRPGDILPTYRDLAPIAGVSEIVTRGALKRLAEEGLVIQRPRVGTVVRDRAAKQWKGHVVLVYEAGDDNYLENKLAGAMRERLLDAGYLMTQSCVRRVGGGKLDFNALDASLSRSVDLAIVMYHRPEINAHLMKAGVPFAVFGEKAAPPRGAVGAIHLDYDRAVPAFAEACKAAGIEEVVEICWHRLMCDVAPGLESAGIRVTKKMVVVDESEGRLIGVKRAGRLAFQAIIQNAECRMHNAQCTMPCRDSEQLRAPAPNLARQRATSRGAAQPRRAYFFADDYLAEGALTALGYAGLHTPEDVRIATFANRGLGPDYPVPLSRMEFDPVRAGETVADTITTYLKTGEFSTGVAVGPTWVKGETLGGNAEC